MEKECLWRAEKDQDNPPELHQYEIVAKDFFMVAIRRTDEPDGKALVMPFFVLERGAFPNSTVALAKFIEVSETLSEEYPENKAEHERDIAWAREMLKRPVLNGCQQEATA